jgi:hypothetical protein
MSRLRRAVMNAMDDYHETTDGSTPDHIIVSRAIWRDLTETGAPSVEKIEEAFKSMLNQSKDFYV